MGGTQIQNTVEKTAHRGKYIYGVPKVLIFPYCFALTWFVCNKSHEFSCKFSQHLTFSWVGFSNKFTSDIIATYLYVIEINVKCLFLLNKRYKNLVLDLELRSSVFLMNSDKRLFEECELQDSLFVALHLWQNGRCATLRYLVQLTCVKPRINYCK